MASAHSYMLISNQGGMCGSHEETHIDIAYCALDDLLDGVLHAVYQSL